ncbi:hypothetical protein PhaeoP97_03679 (plasmid) [Phaeobacter porticola]|uniref:Uncharacterized protein n=1 Tax=Phaeobacter porticola TaxID=1844006 RepID=A0A1L3IA07_9RHOB|nr:hypothetical protein PhaeoP97_03679 [Phaeobacter porticola]
MVAEEIAYHGGLRCCCHREQAAVLDQAGRHRSRLFDANWRGLTCDRTLFTDDRRIKLAYSKEGGYRERVTLPLSVFLLLTAQ